MPVKPLVPRRWWLSQMLRKIILECVLQQIRALEIASKCTFISKLWLLNKSKHSVNSAVSGAISSEQLASLKGQGFWKATAHTMCTACQEPPAGARKDRVKHQEIWEKRDHSWRDWADQIWQTLCIPRRFVRRETERSPPVTGSAIASVLHPGQSSSTSAGVSDGIFPCKDSALLCDSKGHIAGATDYSPWNCKLLWRAVPSEQDEMDSLLPCKSHRVQEASHEDKPGTQSFRARFRNECHFKKRDMSRTESCGCSLQSWISFTFRPLPQLKLPSAGMKSNFH